MRSSQSAIGMNGNADGHDFSVVLMLERLATGQKEADMRVRLTQHTF